MKRGQLEYREGDEENLKSLEREMKYADGREICGCLGMKIFKAGRLKTSGGKLKFLIDFSIGKKYSIINFFI